LACFRETRYLPTLSNLAERLRYILPSVQVVNGDEGKKSPTTDIGSVKW